MSALSDAVATAAADRNMSVADVVHEATKHGVNRATVYRLLDGQRRKPADKTLRAIHAVLPVLTMQQLRELAGMPPGESEEYRPPAEANLLSRRQRLALDELIRSMAERSDGEQRDTAPTNREVREVVRPRALRPEPSEPVVPTAARRGGRGDLRKAADAQDEDAIRPDAEGPEGGA